jgi:hypothetical protein
MSELDEARIEVVRRHMALEITHDWDGVIATFDHPRYELLGPGTVFDGEAAVRSYFAASREPFPDQANEVIAIAADAATDTVLQDLIVNLEPDPEPWHCQVQFGNDRLRHGTQIDRFSVHFGVSHMGKFEQGRDKPAHAQAAIKDFLKKTPGLLVELAAAQVLEHLAIAVDNGQRQPQVVSHGVVEGLQLDVGDRQFGTLNLVLLFQLLA